MKNLFIQATLILVFSLLYSVNMFAENKSTDENNATDISYGSVTFRISGHPGTYYFQYPDERVIYHSGFGTTEVTLNVTATAGLSGAVVQLKVIASNVIPKKLSVYSPKYKANIELTDRATYNVAYLVPLNNGVGSAQMALIE